MENRYWIGRKRSALAMARGAATAQARLIHYDLAGRFSVKAAQYPPPAGPGDLGEWSRCRTGAGSEKVGAAAQPARLIEMLDLLQRDVDIGVWDNEGGRLGVAPPAPLGAVLPPVGARPGVPRFLNDDGSNSIAIGVTAFNCIGATPPADHPHVYLDMGRRSSMLCPYCATHFCHDPALRFDETRPASCFRETGFAIAMKESIQ